MEILKRATLVLACVCMLLVMYRLLKPDFGHKAVEPGVTAAAATQTISPTPVEAPTSTPVPDPVWEWTKIKSDSVVFAPGSGLTGYQVPQNSTPQPVRIGIEAKSPVTVAYFPESYTAAMNSNPLETLKLPIFSCLNQHVLATTVECTLDTSTSGYVLLVKDERTGGQILGATLMGIAGIKKPFEDVAARNDVTIGIMGYVCTRNCTEYDKQR